VFPLTSCLSIAVHCVVHEKNEWFGILLLLEPIPLQISRGQTEEESEPHQRCPLL
jgi:hypothetical protein